MKGILYFQVLFLWSFTTIANESVLKIQFEKILTDEKLIERVEMDGLDVFNFVMPAEVSGGMELKLVCSFNPFYDWRESHMVLTPDTLYRGRKFLISDIDCLHLTKFLKASFEQVSREAPMRITLNYLKGVVEKVQWHEDGQALQSAKSKLAIID